MSVQKPSIPQGTRDFGPVQVARRNYIFGIIRRVFEKFGFAPLETPTMENLSVLTGKYGDEGDQLLFKVLNSGDFLNGKKGPVSAEDLAAGSKATLPKIAEKGLRYDLTVPFARYVVMNRGQLTLPFKRYQIQPVWRADRPQRGRYREFVQCDADVVGTNSLLCEAEIVLMIDEVLSTLGLTDFSIKINHRGVLSGLYEALMAQGTEADLFVAIDKLDKIGKEGVSAELAAKGYSQEMIDRLFSFLDVTGSFEEKLDKLSVAVGQAAGEKRENGPELEDIARATTPEKTATLGKIVGSSRGFFDLRQVKSFLQDFGFENFDHLEFDPTLARGLSYYTGCIFEVKVNNVQMGSISGGGRYDNLTGAFGLPGLSGVGFSFGVDRIYDVLETLELFPDDAVAAPLCLIANFDAEGRATLLPLLRQLRDAGISAELYPEVSKLRKQFEYADKRGIRFMILAGSEERARGVVKLRDMRAGSEQNVPAAEVVAALQRLV